jgi:hypothetical protein
MAHESLGIIGDLFGLSADTDPHAGDLTKLKFFLTP